jgi:hypothetical protein
MKRNFIIFIFILLWTPAFSALENSTSDLPKAFQKSIPTKLKGDLELVSLQKRCDGCNPWRYINYYCNGSREIIKKEKISVFRGYKAMYAYPNTDYFSNTKIEKSVFGEYQHDKKIVIEALKYEYKRKKEHIYTYLKENPDLQAKIDLYKAKNKEYIELQESSYKGYEYITYTENVIGLSGNTISQIHIFVPEEELIITAYLLNQKKANFKTIDEFLKLRDDFIKAYIDFLADKENS